MKVGRGSIRAVFFPTLLAAVSVCGSAQAYKVRPLNPRLRPLFITSGTLTVSATPASVSFALLEHGTATGSSGVTITTTWSLLGIGSTLNLYGYFTSSTAALTDGRSPAHLIPSSAVLGQMTTGVPTTYTAFTQTTPFGAAGAGLTLLNDSIPFTFGGNRTDVLNLEIDLAGISLPAGTYTGTLTVQATMM
jgi:hypothetical protein